MYVVVKKNYPSPPTGSESCELLMLRKFVFVPSFLQRKKKE
jgi:hypothetical protein